MIYKFKSKAAGDVIMMGPNGDQLLRLLGREPAPKGIIEVADMPAALRAIEQALAREEAPADDETAEDDKPAGDKAISLRRRVWPFVELLKRSQSEGHEIVWGV
jgi:hypothetical protein